MSLTITIPGAVNVTTGAMAPAVLTIGVGVPGAAGPQGPAGPGVPAGGTAGQFLTKIDGTNYNTDWTTVNLGAYAVKANNLSDLSSASTARTNLGLGTMATASASDYSTTTAANGLYYPLTGNPSSFLTASALTGYATQSFVASNYAPIAAGLPTGGTVGQVLTKNSGTDYDDSWQTLIPGDRYVTSSTTSNTVGNGAKTFTVGTGLSYSSQQDVVISYDAANHMHAVVTSYNSGTGVLVVDVKSHTGSGTYSSWTVNVGGTTPLQTVEWGEILGTLGDQTDLAAALNAKLETSTAASTYAALAGATFTGEVVTPASTTSNAGLTITPGVAPSTPTNGEIWATTNDLQVRLNGVTETLAEQSWVTAQGYLTSAPVTSVAGRTGAITLAVGDVSGAAALAGATFTGLVNTLASSTAGAGFRLPHGAAPTTPTDGDVWSTTGGLFWRQNAATKQAMNLGDTQTVSGNITFSNANVSLGTSTGAGTINVGSGATLNATTKTVNVGTAGVSGSTTNVNIGSAVSGALGTTTINGALNVTGSTLNIGNSTGATTIGLGNGATLTATTKAVNIGTSGVAGSTTNITIGSTTGTSTTTLQGTTNGVTAAADTNSVALATTAFVVGQAGSATPLVDGTAAIGTSLRYARQDHVHPTDTSRAATASPTFTGTPLSTTAAVDTNTTQIATTAYVVGQASAATPLVDGTAAVGTSLRYARADHVHPTDTSRAPLNSPVFSGTPSLPTGTTAVTQTAGNNTTAVATTAFVTAAVPAFASTAEINSPVATNKVVSPWDVVRMITNRAVFDTQSSSPVFATSGSGAEAYKITNDRVYAIGTPSVGVAGYGQTIFDTQSSSIGVYGGKRGAALETQDWNKRIWITGTTVFPSLGDANCVTRLMLGGRTSATSGSPTKQSVGWRVNGGGGALVLVTYGWNGSALVVTETTSSFTPVANQSFDWMIYHAPNIANPATSFCYLYVNDNLVATGIFAPADPTVNYNYYVMSCEATAAQATRMTSYILPSRVWWSKA